MRYLLVALILSLSFMATAEEMTLIPVHTPKPTYPPELRSDRITGQTKIRFIVHADGSVSDVTAVESDHPQFAQYSIEAVSQWTFKPWTVTADAPSEAEVFAPMIFMLDSPLPLPMDINATLLKTPCRTVNRQVARKNFLYPKQQLRDLRVFNVVIRYLSEGMVSSQLEPAQRTALINELLENLPTIVERCKANPKAAYADQLPASIRGLM